MFATHPVVVHNFNQLVIYRYPIVRYPVGCNVNASCPHIPVLATPQAWFGSKTLPDPNTSRFGPQLLGSELKAGSDEPLRDVCIIAALFLDAHRVILVAPGYVLALLALLKDS